MKRTRRLAEENCLRGQSPQLSRLSLSLPLSLSFFLLSLSSWGLGRTETEKLGGKGPATAKAERRYLRGKERKPEWGGQEEEEEAVIGGGRPPA